MSGKVLTTRLVLRNDTKSAWESANPVLRKGEVGVVFDPSAPAVAGDTYVVDFKIGDGITAWNSLPLFRGPIATRLTTAEGNIATLQGQVAVIQGDATTEGSIAKALADAKAYADALVAGIDLSQIDINKQAIAVLNATAGVAGSVAHAVAAEESRATGAEAALASRITALEGSHFEVVASLPATGAANTIYLVAKPSPYTGYKEWIYVNNAWEEIGDTDIDLSDYYTKSEVYNKTEIGAGFSSTNTVASAITAVSDRVSAIEADYLKEADTFVLDCGDASTNITSS